VLAADVKDGEIQRTWARCDKTEHIYEVTAHTYLDCTGDSRLGLEAGAEMRFGREARSEFGEPLAPETPDEQMLGSSILFTSKKHDRPMPFKAPAWARNISKDQLLKRPTNRWEYGYWWIEWGGEMHTIHDNERIRFELLSIVLGVWDYIKNSGHHPDSANWALDWVGMMTGKRESRRLVGDHLLTQFDLMGVTGDFEDAVAIGGWPMDDHPPGGFDRSDLPPCVQVKTPIYNIPLRSLYSKNIKNLMMAGRNASCTHVAFTSTRVMATCSVMGQAAGTAAALCSRYKVAPRGLYEDKSKLAELQQTLLANDQTIFGRKNEDAADLARSAKVTASAEHEDAQARHVTNGYVRDMAGQWTNRWSAPLEGGPAWLQLAWNKPERISRVQITFDSGFHRELTLTSSDSINAAIVRAPQPETVKDYELQYRASVDGKWESLVKIEGNHQRLVRHSFPPVEAQDVRLVITATNGEKLARVFEVRCYA
jgi:hypothetical protein